MTLRGLAAVCDARLEVSEVKNTLEATTTTHFTSPERESIYSTQQPRAGSQV